MNKFNWQEIPSVGHIEFSGIESENRSSRDKVLAESVLCHSGMMGIREGQCFENSTRLIRLK